MIIFPFNFLLILTGDVAFRILEDINSTRHRAMQDATEDYLHEETRIHLCDINPNMLNVGKKRAIERGKGSKGKFPTCILSC